MTIASALTIVGLCLSATAIGVTIYNAKKKETKEDAGTMSTVLFGINSIKEDVSEMKRDVRDMRTEYKQDMKDVRAELRDFDKRLGVVEVIKGLKHQLDE